MKTISQNIIYREKASRLELFVRIIWVTLAEIVLIFYGVLVCFSLVIQFFHVLVFGKRHKILYVITKALVVQNFRISAYANFLTDERPPIIPEIIRH